MGNVPSKYQLNQDVWVKVDPHTKWMAGKISQILPNQSYVVSLSDGCTFCCNEHHITRRLSCIKPRATSEADENSHSYNLRPRKTVKHVHWLDCPAAVNQGELGESNYQ